jgi:hypothetical protein
MMKFEINKNWTSIQKPVVGDIVKLKFQDQFLYALQVEVLSENNNEFSGKVLRIFADDSGEVSDNDNIISTVHQFDVRSIFAVL